ncbi:MAG TPA: VOC family protein [Burkholderiales bacterium]|nr:VOC family protein [Burkholderiales bacterium]
MNVEPYLFFEGRCEEALEFYKKAIGAKVEALMRYRDSPEPQPPGMSPPADKVMHALFSIGEAKVMASDGMCTGSAKFNGFALTLNARDDAEAKRMFGALSEGGQVQMPLAPTFFASSFGMLTDRFGLGWMVLAQKEQG